MKKLNYKTAAVTSALLLTLGIGSTVLAAQPVPVTAALQTAAKTSTAVPHRNQRIPHTIAASALALPTKGAVIQEVTYVPKIQTRRKPETIMPSAAALNPSMHRRRILNSKSICRVIGTIKWSSSAEAASMAPWLPPTARQKAKEQNSYRPSIRGMRPSAAMAAIKETYGIPHGPSMTKPSIILLRTS